MTGFLPNSALILCALHSACVREKEEMLATDGGEIDSDGLLLDG